VIVGRGGNRERGATLVEGAVALPLLVLFVLGMVDLGLWVFQSTQASSAARDGARAGILRYQQADVPTSADAAAIRSAVARRIGAQPFGAPLTVQVRCVTAGQNVAVSGGCAAASVINRDRVEVTVTWPRRALSFVTQGFGVSQTVKGQTAMVLLGRPSGVTLGP
jgi:Flp pilus assembly protein TadG